METKVCSVCKQDLPLEDFHRSKSSRDGRGYRCAKCDYSAQKEYKKRRYETYKVQRRTVQRKHKYGLTDEQFTKLLGDQCGKCACCGVELDDSWTRQHKHNKLVIDHDHKTGLVRGLLCTMCNKGLGLLGDNLEGLQKAVDYLKKHETH